MAKRKRDDDAPEPSVTLREPDVAETGFWIRLDSFEIALALLALESRLDVPELSPAERSVIRGMLRSLRKGQAAFAPGGALHGQEG